MYTLKISAAAQPAVCQDLLRTPKALKNGFLRHQIGLQPNEYAREQLLI